MIQQHIIKNDFKDLKHVKQHLRLEPSWCNRYETKETDNGMAAIIILTMIIMIHIYIYT